MKPLVHVSILAIAALAPLQGVRAAVCDSTLGSVHVTTSGEVLPFLTSLAKYVQVCNLNEEWKGISTSTCFGWFASLNTAVTSGNTVRFVWGSPSACADVPQYGDTAPAIYIMLKNS